MSKLNKIWSERKLIEELDLRDVKEDGTGRSRIISGWIRKGLAYLDMSNGRYFIDDDVLSYMNGYREPRHKSEK